MKILYAINGDGLGHTTRSIPVIEYLQNKYGKKNISIITSSKRSFDFISEIFKNVKYYEGLKLFYKKNKLRITKTTTYNTNLIIFKRIYSKVKKLVLEINPDIIVTDCDHITTKIASKLDIPVICICNIHSMSEFKLDVKKEDKLSLKISNIPSKLFSKDIKHHIITTFFRKSFIDNSKKNKETHNPIIRKEFINAKITDQKYYLIYQTSNNNSELLDTISQKKYSKYTFVVYGFEYEISKKYNKYSNIFFKNINTKEFFSDLINCKACITNGGHTFITEAIYLKKPILSIPVSGQYEQKLNAIELEKLGYGLMCNNSNIKEFSEKFSEFTKNISKYKKNLSKLDKWDNNKLFHRLDELIKKYTRI